MSPTIQLEEVTVYLFTICGERLPTVDIDLKIGYIQKLHSKPIFQNIGVRKKPSLSNVPTVFVHHPPHVRHTSTVSTPAPKKHKWPDVLQM